ncbi:hypothetical protein [Puia dinghuensis]|uniref:Uncharacterized protein n=1 Tax=Puia dinghuensis TaxID=1792502 RepID=A0A8J2U8L5_9BACT|nr:hypothetical protein [Puia dinghuensis]GGA85879.1 hypothetical protein GCM10011511_06170 [Puia dinghuensis]
MRFILSVILTFSCCLSLFSQRPCKRRSPLFQFDTHARPRLFTEKLGSHPQFPFLQAEKGIVTRALFIRAVKDPDSRKQYKTEFTVFNRLLQDIGFAGGYKDLRAANVQNLFINPGTIGNLGFFNKESNYSYVTLNPAEEGEDGIAAWKITGPGGCYFYILHTCGNAFFVDEAASGSIGCCREVTIKARPDTSGTGIVHERPLHLGIRFYQGMLVAVKKKKGYDTVFSLLRSIDTVIRIKDTRYGGGRVTTAPFTRQWLLCRDTVLALRIPLTIDSAGAADTLSYTYSDTVWLRSAGNDKDECHKKWEIALDGGGSFNSIPRFDNTAKHSRTNGAQPTARLTVSHIFNHWFQAGISASWFTLSYQDDIPYPGSTPNTYNTVYPGKPIIPLEVFAKATIGGPIGWQSDIALSAGYSFVSGDKILSGGATLGVKPGTKNGPTAGFKMGVAYFFNCRWGLGLSFEGRYFDNKAAAMTYHLFALPVTLGIRYRF